MLATLTNNKGFENPIQICVFSNNEEMDIKGIKKDNEWTGETQLPLPNYCALF